VTFQDSLFSFFLLSYFYEIKNIFIFFKAYVYNYLFDTYIGMETLPPHDD